MSNFIFCTEDSSLELRIHQNQSRSPSKIIRSLVSKFAASGDCGCPFKSEIYGQSDAMRSVEIACIIFKLYESQINRSIVIKIKFL
jgi:hypothetical protein